jgi:L-amino acid N-acyltransferase YncA
MAVKDPGSQRMAARDIRVASVADAAAIAAIYAPYVTDTAISFELEPPGKAEMARRIEEVLQRAPWLVAERDGEVLGYAYASRHRDRAAYQWSADVAVYTAPAAQRTGAGSALYRLLLSVLREQGYHQAFGGITLPNAASVGLHEAMGFSLVGVYRRVGFKLGAWRDVGWWGLELGPPAASPTEPRRFEAAMLEWARDA